MYRLPFFFFLQMSMEFQVPSPLVPTRESYFVRYCKNNPDGTWAVVDVSLDSLRPSPVIKCRRRPSGCLIQEMPNGYSKVIISELFPSCPAAAGQFTASACMETHVHISCR